MTIQEMLAKKAAAGKFDAPPFCSTAAPLPPPGAPLTPGQLAHGHPLTPCPLVTEAETLALLRFPADEQHARWLRCHVPRGEASDGRSFYNRRDVEAMGRKIEQQRAIEEHERTAATPPGPRLSELAAFAVLGFRPSRHAREWLRRKLPGGEAKRGPRAYDVAAVAALAASLPPVTERNYTFPRVAGSDPRCQD